MELLLAWLDRSAEFESIRDGSGSSHFDGPEGWIHGLTMARLPVQGHLQAAVRELRDNVQVGRLVQCMVNRLAPGGSLAPHRDGLPSHMRFHLPLKTNPDAYWWDELNGKVHMRRGHWYGPVPYCGVLHSAVNDGDSERVHLVIDFEPWGM